MFNVIAVQSLLPINSEDVTASQEDTACPGECDVSLILNGVIRYFEILCRGRVK